MKILKQASAMLLLIAALISCSKNGESPDTTTVVPLIKQMVVTSPDGRVIYNNTYDDNKRLATVGDATGVISYDAAGFEVSNSGGNSGKLITTVSLQNGHITDVLSHASNTESYHSTFTYDDKGRLIRIDQHEALNGNNINTITYSYSWDDNDNLIATETNYGAGVIVKTTYSGFLPENVNTLGGKNSGFDYFGTASYLSNYTPNNSVVNGSTFPNIYPGKILPSVIKPGNSTIMVTYHKNTQGYIDQVVKDYGYKTITTDVAYQ